MSSRATSKDNKRSILSRVFVVDEGRGVGTELVVLVALLMLLADVIEDAAVLLTSKFDIVDATEA